MPNNDRTRRIKNATQQETVAYVPSTSSDRTERMPAVEAKKKTSVLPWILGGAVALFFVCGGALGIGGLLWWKSRDRAETAAPSTSSNASRPDASANRPEPKVDKPDLSRLKIQTTTVQEFKAAWKANSANFKERFAGKWVRLKGTVRRVTRFSLENTDCLEVQEPDNDFSNVECLFQNQDDLKKFTPGKPVVVLGVVKIHYSRPTLVRCFLPDNSLLSDPEALAVQQQARAEEEREKRLRDQEAEAARAKERQHELELKKAEEDRARLEREAEELRLQKEREEAKRKEEARKRREEKAKADAEAERMAEEERKAQVMLRPAMILMDRGFKKEPAERLQKIIDKYPDTQAADKARKLLEQLKGK